jgi:hypothetical protein
MTTEPNEGAAPTQLGPRSAPDRGPAPEAKNVVAASSTPRSPAGIREHGRARNAFWRTIFGGAVLSLVCIALIASIICKSEHVGTLATLVGSGLGFMLGQRAKETD